MYGWMTNTGVKFVIIVDMEGRSATSSDAKVTAAVGLRDADVKPVCHFAFRLCSRLDDQAGFQSVADGLYWSDA